MPDAAPAARAASTSLDARTRRRSFGWCQIICIACRRSTTTYDRAAKAVTYRSDKSEGATAGTETVDPLEFLDRVLVHIPDTGHVTPRSSRPAPARPRPNRVPSVGGV